jgi:predicted ATP-grasp superfamily ATP-dependent carboligase
VFHRCRPWADALVAQEWIEGPDTGHFTCNAYFDANATPVATFVSQKLRQWPLEGGTGCFSQECRNDTVRDETIRLFQGLRYHGLAYLEMKLDPRTGRHLIIEPNVGRPTGRSASADRAGVDLLYTQFCDALGAPLPPARQQTYDGRKWIYLRQDCQASFAQWRRGALGARAWLRSLRGCRGDAVFAWRDPKPFVADLFHACGKAIGQRAGAA